MEMSFRQNGSRNKHRNRNGCRYHSEPFTPDRDRAGRNLVSFRFVSFVRRDYKHSYKVTAMSMCFNSRVKDITRVLPYRSAVCFILFPAIHPAVDPH